MRHAMSIHGSTTVGRGQQALVSSVLRVALGYREVLVLDGDRRGTVVVAGSGGVLWVTQAGDPEDHILAPGGRFTITSPGRVVLQGMR